MKKIYLPIFLFSFLIFNFNSVSAISISEYGFGNTTNDITKNLTPLVNILKNVNFGSLFSSKKSVYQSQNALQISNPQISKQEYEAKLKEIGSKVNSLIIKTAPSTNSATACSTGNAREIESCKRGLFIGCAEALSQNLQMVYDCKQFNTADYKNYLDSKNAEMNLSNPFLNPQPANTTFGQIYPVSYVPSAEEMNYIQSSQINSNFIPYNVEVATEIRNLVEPTYASSFNLSNTNTNAGATYDGYIRGWATLFATKGGANEAGQKMNKFTAFGYNPYDPKTCIASLPFKTIDKFFGTTLDQCIKNKDSKCIGQIKSKIKDRAIEVVMLKNGKRGVFPLGDLGPAEWTGNAIDFTQCAANILGATGKDLVEFRPAPQQSF